MERDIFHKNVSLLLGFLDHHLADFFDARALVLEVRILYVASTVAVQC